MHNTNHHSHRPRVGRADERGASGVEFLIMATVLIGLFTMLVQFGINMYAARVAEAAAREGATTAARWDGSADAGKSTAKEYVTDSGNPAVRGSSASASRSAEKATVTVTVTVVSVLPWMDEPITSTATAPVERFVQ